MVNGGDDDKELAPKTISHTLSHRSDGGREERHVILPANPRVRWIGGGDLDTGTYATLATV
jgi:hypothetical protein